MKHSPLAESNGSRRAAAVSQWRGIAKSFLIVHISVPEPKTKAEVG
jgi:hypothetical protein